MRVKVLLGIVFILFFTTWVGATPITLDSQTLALAQMPQDSLEDLVYTTEGIHKVDVLNALSWKIKFSNPNRSYRLAKQARDFAESLNYPMGVAFANKHMGLARTNQGRYREALSLVFEEIEMRKALQDTMGIAIANNNIGYILRQQKNYDLALEYFRRSLELTAEKVYLPSLRALTLNSVGHIYRIQGSYELSEKAHLESLAVLDEGQELGKFARATTLNNLGKLYLEQNQYGRALLYFFETLELEEQLNNPLRQSQSINNISLAYLGNNKLDSAQFYAEKGMVIARTIDNKAPLRDLEHTCALIYKAMGNFEMAYLHESRYANLNDSLLMAEKETEISTLENRFLSTQKQNEIDLLNERQAAQDAELRKVRLTNYGIIGLALFIFVIAGLLYLNNRLKRRANLILLAQKNEVRKQRDELEQSNLHLNKVNHEMDSFMYRVSHDLRSPLTSVMGLISLASQEQDTTKRDQYLQLMQKSLKKLDGFIQDIIDVTRNNRQDVKYVEINLKAMVKEYFDQYKYHDGRTDIVCEYESKGLANLINDEYRLGIILSNLISNAIRYSTEYREDAVVKVSTQIDEERALIQVRDNGPGITEEHQAKIFDMFFRGENVTGGSGLGLYIVKETVEKIGGNIRVASEVRHGATFTLELPNQKLGTEKQSPSIGLEQVLNA